MSKLRINKYKGGILSGVRGLIGKLAVNELSKVNPTAHTTQI